MLLTRISTYVSVAINIAVIMGRINAHRAAVGIYLHPLQRSASLGSPAVTGHEHLTTILPTTFI
jgi:hypothetical protein